MKSGNYRRLFDGAAPRYLASGHILFYRNGTYQMVPFDAEGLEVNGPETVVLREVRRLGPAGAAESYATVSETGVLAYVESLSTRREPPSRFVWVTQEGERQSLPFEGNHGDFSLSPDGTRVAVQHFANGQQHIPIYDLERGTAEQITRDGQNRTPTWHPDGRRLAFTSQRNGNFDVFQAVADGSAHPTPLLATERDEGPWWWAPDGESGIFEYWSEVSGRDLWRAGATGENPEPLLASELSERDAAFSPDGRRLAYLSDGRLYVSSYPGLEKRALISPAASRPRWSRSTNELFLVEKRRMRAVRYDTRGGAFRTSEAGTLFEVEGLADLYEVAPDGKRFLFLSPTAENWGRDVIRVVLNGFDRLPRLVGRYGR